MAIVGSHGERDEASRIGPVIARTFAQSSQRACVVETESEKYRTLPGRASCQNHLKFAGAQVK